MATSPTTSLIRITLRSAPSTVMPARRADRVGNRFRRLRAGGRCVRLQPVLRSEGLHAEGQDGGGRRPPPTPPSTTASSPSRRRRRSEETRHAHSIPLFPPSPRPAAGSAAALRTRRPWPPQRFDAGTLSGLRPQHRLGHHERLRSPPWPRSMKPSGKLTFTSAPRRAACGSPRTAAPASSRCSTSSQCGPSALSPSIPNDHDTVWEPANWTRNLSRSVTASTRPPTAARAEAHGLPNLSASPRSRRPRQQTPYACVPGRLWSDPTDRGLYKTSDGGKTWSRC